MANKKTGRALCETCASGPAHMSRAASVNELHDDHDVLSLGGARPVSIEATEAAADVGMALDLHQDIGLFSSAWCGM